MIKNQSIQIRVVDDYKLCYAEYSFPCVNCNKYAECANNPNLKPQDCYIINNIQDNFVKTVADANKEGLKLCVHAPHDYDFRRACNLVAISKNKVRTK